MSAGRRRSLTCAALTTLALALVSGPALASGAGAVAFVAAMLIVWLQALLAMMLCEVGLSLLLTEPSRRRELASLHVAALVASGLAMRWPWLGPTFVALPIVAALWSARRGQALVALGAAAALGALGAWWSAAAIVLVVGVVVPFLPIGVALYRAGKPRAAIVSVVSLTATLWLFAWALGQDVMASRIVWPGLLFTVAAAPLSIFLFREGNRRAALATLVLAPLLLSGLSLLR